MKGIPSTFLAMNHFLFNPFNVKHMAYGLIYLELRVPEQAQGYTNFISILYGNSPKKIGFELWVNLQSICVCCLDELL